MKAQLTKPIVSILIAGFILATSVPFWGNDGFAGSLAKGLFPNSELIWEREFDGKIRDVQVGGGNVVVLWWKGNDIIDKGQLSIISYLSSKGDVLWEKIFAWHLPGEWDKEGYVESISLSKNGKALIVNTVVGPGEGRRVYSYDAEGNFRWETGAIEPGLSVSSEGNYAIITCESEEEMAGRLRVFDNKTGKEIWNDREPYIDWSAIFLSDGEIAYVKGRVRNPYCKLILFNAESLQVKWEVDISKKLTGEGNWGISYYTPRVRASKDGKLIAIGVDNFEPEKYHRMKERKLVMLNNKGDILWYTNPIGSHTFPYGSKYLLVGSNWKFDLLDPLTGHRLWRVKFENFRCWHIDHIFFFRGKCFLPVVKWVRGEDAKELVLVLDEKTGNQIGEPVESIMAPMGDKYLIMTDEDKSRIQKVQID